MTAAGRTNDHAIACLNADGWRRARREALRVTRDRPVCVCGHHEGHHFSDTGRCVWGRDAWKPCHCPGWNLAPVTQ